MADLGSLAMGSFLHRGGARVTTGAWAATNAARDMIRSSLFIPMPTAYFDPSASGNSAVSITRDKLEGAVSGNVKAQDNSPIVGAKVVALDGRTFIPVGWTVTDANGDYAFTKLNRLSGDYIILVRHPTGVEKAEVFDRIDAL